MTYTAKSPHIETQVETVNIVEIELSAIGAHGTNNWTHNIEVPPLPATNTLNCKIITIAYQLYVSLNKI